MFESCSSTRGSRLKGRKDSAGCYAVTERWRASRKKRSPSALALAAAASPIWNAAPGAFHIRTPRRVWQQHLSWAEPSGRLSWPPAGRCGLGRLGATGSRSSHRRSSDDNVSLPSSRSCSHSRVLTLTGSGGIGKTRIALELAHQLESEYADGAVFIDLAPVFDASLVPQAVAAPLGVSARPGESVTDSVRKHLQPSRVLLVLDNCEHVLTACAELADLLIRTSSSLQLIVTSREPLRIHGETVWVVPPLASNDSVELFIQRAQAVVAAARMTSEDIDTDRRDLRPAGGHASLAIELAAVRVPALGVAHVADLLRGGRPRLPVARQSARFAAAPGAARGARLRAVALFDSSEQRLFVRLTVFAGSWSLDAARAVCASGGISSYAVLDGLVGLVDKSLVLAEDSSGHRRYRFLETIREYAVERLAASGDSEQTRRATRATSVRSPMSRRLQGSVSATRVMSPASTWSTPI